MNKDIFLSVVCTINNRADGLHEKLSVLQKSLAVQFAYYEIVLVVQGPANRQINATEIQKITSNVSCVRIIQVSSIVHPEVLYSAGLENSVGDFIVIYDLYTDPVSIVSESVSMCAENVDVIIGISKKKKKFLYRLARLCAGKILKVIDYPYVKNDTGLRCISRRAANAVINEGRFHYQMNLRLHKTGFLNKVIEYEQKPKKNEKTFITAFVDFFRLIVFNSSKPLRWMSFLGISGGGLGFCFALYSVLVHYFKSGVVEGWTTTILFISLLFTILFVILAFITEYIGRLLDEVRGKSKYSIVFEENSTIMLSSDLKNVVDG